MRQSLFKNKKGQFVDILGGIQRAIGWFFQTAPKPLLLIIFLLLLVGFASIFSLLLNMTGNFCDTAGNEYRTGTLRFVTNTGLLTSMPSEEEINLEVMFVDEKVGGILPQCTKFLFDPYYYEGGLFSTDKDYLATGSGYYYDGRFCTDCDTERLFGNVTHDSGVYCTGDVYKLDNEEKNFAQKTFCGKNSCEPPEGYYYDRTRNVYVCIDDLCLNEEGEKSTNGQMWNLKLKEKGAVIQPPSQYGDRDYRNVVQVECDVGDLNPKLRTFGINLFNYKLWILLFILSALVWVVFKIKRH